MNTNLLLSELFNGIAKFSREGEFKSLSFHKTKGGVQPTLHGGVKLGEPFSALQWVDFRKALLESCVGKKPQPKDGEFFISGPAGLWNPHNVKSIDDPEPLSLVLSPRKNVGHEVLIIPLFSDVN